MIGSLGNRKLPIFLYLLIAFFPLAGGIHVPEIKVAPDLTF
jgi:hypothetical protein